MIRTLLATTAFTALLSGAALAQTTTVGTDTETSIFSQDSNTQVMDSTNGYFEANTNQILASALLGKTIYNGSDDDAQEVGNVNDVVMSADGKAQAVVVGVGGFLGMGEKEVAVDFSRLNWVTRDNDRILIMSTTADELKSAPAFDRNAIMKTQDGMEAHDGAAMDTTQNVAPGTEPATPMTEPAPTAETTPKANTAMAESPREGLQVVANTDLSAEKLIGTRVYGSNDSDLGEIGDVIVSADGGLEAYIVDVGGFLGLGEKPVALDATQLDIMQDANGNLSIYTPYTEEQLNAQPTYSEDAYKENRDLIVVR